MKTGLRITSVVKSFCACAKTRYKFKFTGVLKSVEKYLVAASPRQFIFNKRYGVISGPHNLLQLNLKAIYVFAKIIYTYCILASAIPKT